MKVAENTASFDIDRERQYEELLKTIALDACTGLSCEVFLFGSRVRGKARRTSDFDIGIRGLDRSTFMRVKRAIDDAVERSPIPHEVDIVDFDQASKPFMVAALRERKIWKNA